MKTLKLGKPKYLNKAYLHALIFLPQGTLMNKTLARSRKRGNIL
jgi:hypothetical protein